MDFREVTTHSAMIKKRDQSKLRESLSKRGVSTIEEAMQLNKDNIYTSYPVSKLDCDFSE